MGGYGEAWSSPVAEPPAIRNSNHTCTVLIDQPLTVRTCLVQESHWLIYVKNREGILGASSRAVDVAMRVPFTLSAGLNGEAVAAIERCVSGHSSLLE